MDDQRTDRASSGVRFRKLRIALSVVGLATFISLIGLWLLDYKRTVIVLLGGIMLATPFFRHLNRLPARFSLRTLLVATTLLAVILGAIVYAAK